MLQYRCQMDQTLFQDEMGNLVNIDEVKRQILAGEDIRVSDSRTNADITQTILIRILSHELEHADDSHVLNRELQNFIRSNSHPRNRDDLSLGASPLDRERLSVWMTETLSLTDFIPSLFGRRLYSWDFVTLMGTVIIYHWRNQPLENETAFASLPGRSRKTRLERVKALIADGWIARVQHGSDRRRTSIVATEKLTTTVRAFAGMSLVACLSSLNNKIEFNTNVAALINTLREKNDGRLDQSHLLPWSECLMYMSTTWRQIFGSEFPRIEYGILFTRAVLSAWRREPLLFDDFCSQLRVGSIRTHKTRINRAIDSNLIKRSKQTTDMRVSVYLPTAELERKVELCFQRTLDRFISCVEQLPVS